MKDAESVMIVRSQGAMSPTTEEIVLPTEEVHLVHKILGDVVVESGRGWLTEWWEGYPLEMQLEGDVIAEIGEGWLEGVEIG